MSRDANDVDKNQEARALLALEDSVDHIFHFMTIEELYNSAQVCRSWYREAIQAIRRQLIDLNPGKSVQISKIIDLQSPSMDLQHLGRSITLLFTSYEQECSAECIEMYEKIFYTRVFVIKNITTWFHKNVVKTFSKPVLMHHLPGLLLQESANTQIRISSCTENEARFVHNISIKMCNELMSEIKDNSKQIFLLFTTSPSSDQVAEEIIQKAAQRLQPTSYVIWGGQCHSFKKSNDNLKQMTGVLGLTISSPNLETWSCFLSCFDKSSKVNEDLLKFKSHIKLRNHNVGLIFGPHDVHDSPFNSSENSENNYYNSVYHKASDFTNVIKATFSEISFIGTFHQDYENIFGNSSFNQTVASTSIYGMVMSLLIITYD